ncbi:MAG: CHASE2 domain-containing protein [Leptolyngbya sp. SIO4C1]|nr:CHASE2 domain-containing protein [Leptolyngbya sp. SIO4C1]
MRLRPYHVWQLLPGIAAVLLVAISLKLGLWQPLELAAYQSLFHLRGPVGWDSRIAIIEIDEPSLAELGAFP